MEPKLLDLFCGAGGSAVGYARAGFAIYGIDNRPQPHYPFPFLQMDAMEVMERLLRGEGLTFSNGETLYLADFDAYHASPPCQAYTVAGIVHRNNGKVYPELIEATRFRLLLTGKPFVIENVPPAAKLLINPITLCGVQFGLGVFRHRKFECNFELPELPHIKHDGKIGDGKYFSVAGGAGRWKSWGKVYRNVSKGTVAQWREAMGIDWMLRKEIKEAIPPAYTEYIGKFLLQEVMRYSERRVEWHIREGASINGSQINLVKR